MNRSNRTMNRRIWSRVINALIALQWLCSTDNPYFCHNLFVFADVCPNHGVREKKMGGVLI